MGISRHIGEYKTSKERRIYSKLVSKKAMDDAIDHYSNGTNVCKYCGEHRREFLTLDHIHADRKIWNKSHGIRENSGGTNLARALRVRNWPEGIQVLCYNCNMLKGSHITSKGFRKGDRSHLDPTAVKTCTACKQEKNILYFNLGSRSKSGLDSKCSDCRNKLTKMYNFREKERVVKHLGGKCSCCGEERIEYLSTEHSNNDGKLHREDIRQRYNLKTEARRLGGVSFNRYMLKDIEQNILWPGLEAHCFNCNSAKGAYGYCPHEVERGEVILDINGNPIRLKERNRINDV